MWFAKNRAVGLRNSPLRVSSTLMEMMLMQTTIKSDFTSAIPIRNRMDANENRSDHFSLIIIGSFM